MPVTRDQELEEFKTRIDLRAYAASLGYELDRRESWRGSSVMRHTNGDKIIVKRDSDGHYVYFSVRDDADNGSIIDFIQKRRSCNLGHVRLALRDWTGRPAADLPRFPALPATARNRLEVEAAYCRMQDALTHPYLVAERGLPVALLSSPRFAGRIRMDSHGNAVFPHFDQEGLCGYELKNRGFTGFAKGGEKGLWFSHTEKTDTRLVVAESAIDAISHASLFSGPLVRYASVGGQMNPRQPELISATILRLSEGSEVVAAMDADENGRKMAEMVRQALLETGRQDLRFSRHEPEGSKDWNDELRQLARPSFPTALPSNQ
jgi:hypothetical protein